MALTTSGWQCPVELTAIPAAKSMYFWLLLSNKKSPFPFIISRSVKWPLTGGMTFSYSFPYTHNVSGGTIENGIYLWYDDGDGGCTEVLLVPVTGDGL